ncbi:MAG: hypothetical protein H6898_11375 [Rhodobacter sp.]|nr:hypothetical protein [Paracoccaceae bacterium]MCC0077169.1 hypothetical protein [Rhodobacter sp.]
MRKRFSLVLAVLLATALPAAAQNYIGSYSAWIGGQDLYNSNGQRLWEAWQILRQDRANFHRFNRRDPNDGGDPWFADANARAQLEQAVMNAGLAPYQRQQILNGGVMVQVDLFGWPGQITNANVQVFP